MRRRAWMLMTAVVFVALPAAASDDVSGGSPSNSAPVQRAPFAPWGPKKEGWADVVFTAFGGDGIRFNNPYRLATVLGSQAQSLSRTAAYADTGLALLLSDPTRLTAGFAVRFSLALEGIQQAIMTPAFLLLHRWSEWGFYGRAGVPLVANPDVTWGLEGGVGAIWFVTAGIGVAAELVGDVFYGAGTREVATPAYPVLSGQGGLWLSWEHLP
jgi:hypothetical protein